MKSFLFITGTLCLAVNVVAQSLSPVVVSTAGAFQMAGGIMLSSTVGEGSIIETSESPPIILTQGFHQPENYEVVGVEQLSEFFSYITIFPNPVSEYLSIQYHSEDLKTSARIVDFKGSEIFAPFILTSGEPYVLNMESLAAGLYLLEVRHRNQTTFIKIAKVQ